MFPSDTDFDTKITLETEASPIDEDAPFRLLFWGDWSGRESRSTISEQKESKPIEIDRDNFEEVFRKLNVELSLDFHSGENSNLSVRFDEYDDFHPDNLFQKLPLFADLREIRRQLVNPQTFNAAAREVRSWLTEDKPSADNSVEENPAVRGETVSSDNLLDQIIGRADNADSTDSKSQTTESSELRAFVKNIVKPHLVQTDTEEQSKLLLIVDEIVSDLMRKILHHPQFQALESGWRGIHSLTRKIETDRSLKIYIIDFSKTDLIDNLKAVNSLADSVFYNVTSAESSGFPDEDFWAVNLGNYSFSLNVDDVAALMRIGKIAASFDTPFISHLKPQIFGFDSFQNAENQDSWRVSEDSSERKLWDMLRSAPESPYLAMVMPRLLSRLPYGKKTEPTEGFYFEEFTSDDRHEDFLWSNPIFSLAKLLADTFQQRGWNMSEHFLQDIENLPFYSYREEQESEFKPCAEILMTQGKYEKLMEEGLMPMISFKNTDKVRVGSWQSIAHPPQILRGRWN